MGVSRARRIDRRDGGSRDLAERQGVRAGPSPTRRASRAPSGPVRTMTWARPVRRISRLVALPVRGPGEQTASRWLQLHQSERVSTGPSTAPGMSATSGPGSTNSTRRAAGRRPRPPGSHPSRTNQAVTRHVDRIAWPDPDQVPGVRLAQRLGTQVSDERPFPVRLDQSHVETRVDVRVRACGAT